MNSPSNRTGHMLDFKEVRDEFDNLIESSFNIIERAWPKGRGNEHTPGVVWGNVRIAYTMYRAARYVAAEQPIDYARKPEYVLAIPPMIRSVADALANLVYLFQDLEPNTWRYIRSGFREEFESLERDRSRFEGDPRWAEYLADKERQIDGLRTQLAIPTGTERSIPYWPYLAQMKRDPALAAHRLEYLNFVERWFYNSLSAETHLSAAGLIPRAEFLLRPQHALSERDLNQLSWIRSEQLSDLLLLLLCIVAEVDLELSLGLRERIVRIWFRINQYQPLFEKVYERWYRARLAS